MTSASRSALLCTVLAFVANDAAAHPLQFHVDGFAGGLAHPFLGLDHVLAGIAIGVWAFQCGPRARVALPLAFIVAVAAGAMLALMGATVPNVEAAVAATVLAIGLLVALAIELPLYAGIPLVALFALAHGSAHGAELAGTAHPWSALAGLLIATASLVAAGALAARCSDSRLVTMRAVGACIGLVGIGLLTTA